MNTHRNPTEVFNAAIKCGALSLNVGADDHASNWMYMGDNAEGKALFKNTITRVYMPPVQVTL